MCKGAEECLELVGMKGTDVVEYSQGFQTPGLTVPIDLDFSNCLEGLVELARFFGDVIQRRWKKACSDGINGSFHAARGPRRFLRRIRRSVRAAPLPPRAG
jgi:hypothetical protein